MKTRNLAVAAVVGAAYASLTMFLGPAAYLPVQLRLSEALCVLPFFMPCTAWGLFVGCAMANVISVAGWYDVVFGSLATLLAGLCTARIGEFARKSGKSVLPSLLACGMPVLFNGPIIGAVLAYALMPDTFLTGFALFCAQIMVEEAAVMYLVGLPLMYALSHVRFVKQFALEL